MCGLFALIVALGAFISLRSSANSAAGFLPSIYGSLSLFTAFWWMVAAITFTSELAAESAADRCAAACMRSVGHIFLHTWRFLVSLLYARRLLLTAPCCMACAAERGQQADDDGLEYGSARTTVIALSWIEAVLAFLSFALVVYDR